MEREVKTEAERENQQGKFSWVAYPILRIACEN